MKSINNFWKKVLLIPVLAGGVAISSFAQYPNGQYPNGSRQQDEATCSQQSTMGKHKTLKDAGIGAVGGAVVGKVVGKPGVGAAAGGAAGGVYGHKKGQNGAVNAKKYNKCMRQKGYNM